MFILKAPKSYSVLIGSSIATAVYWYQVKYDGFKFGKFAHCDIYYNENYHEWEDDEESKLVRMGQSYDQTELDQVHEALQTCLDPTHNAPEDNNVIWIILKSW